VPGVQRAHRRHERHAAAAEHAGVVARARELGAQLARGVTVSTGRLERVLGARVAPRAHVGREARHGAAHVAGHARVAL
jgi:hypothetical protein